MQENSRRKFLSALPTFFAASAVGSLFSFAGATRKTFKKSSNTLEFHFPLQGEYIDMLAFSHGADHIQVFTRLINEKLNSRELTLFTRTVDLKKVGFQLTFTSAEAAAAFQEQLVSLGLGKDKMKLLSA